MKHSIQRQLLVIFAASLTISTIVCAYFSYRSTYDMVLRQSRNNARNGARLTEALLAEVGLDALSDPANETLYAGMRSRLRTVCRAFSLQYLYVFTVDDNSVRHYIIGVADDDADDRVAAEALCLGASSGSPLHEQELSALRGEESDKPWFVDNQYGSTVDWISPYRDESGQVAALIGADFSVDMGSMLVDERFMIIILPVAAVLLLTFAVLFWLLRRRVIAPVRMISERMEHFVEDQERQTKPLCLTSEDEMQSIAEAFENMTWDIHVYIKELSRATAEQASAKAQMDAARRIQYGMVPALFHEKKGGVDVSASMEPAREVGGDFYDCFTLPDGRYCALIGDVSGKGLTAALFMVMAKSMLHDHLKLGLAPDAALSRVNDELCAENPEGLFVTVFALVFDPKTGVLQFANGGHNVPLLLRKEGADYLHPESGVVLGVFEDADFENESVTLAPEEGILLYTDGITDAINTEEQFFGADRLRSLLAEETPRDSETAREAVHEAVTAFFVGCEQFDDMTLLALFRRGPGELELPVTLDSLDTIKSIVLERGGEKGKQVFLVCDEVLANIVAHSGAEHLYFTCDADGKGLTVVFRDDGKAFDPLAEESMVSKDFYDLDSGGMGLGFIRALTSDASWRYENGQNVLTLRFT